MQYRSCCLSDFEFHDAVLKLQSYQEKNLVVTAETLNIHKDTEQNTGSVDMEIEKATITFRDFEIHTLEPMRAYQRDENGNLHTNDPEITYTGNEAQALFFQELKESISLNGFSSEKSDGRIRMELDTNGAAFFAAVCSCTHGEIAWDAYCGRAWYEKIKSYQYPVKLSTPEGEQESTVWITCRLDDQGETIAVNTYLCYQSQNYFGQGTDVLWIDAIADLQKHLPAGVILSCCVACRHGNLCPVGNWPNEVFCLKDVVPKEKSDVYFYTEDETERDKRSRACFDCCGDFAPQTNEYYTYNDYLIESK